jgi:two-component system, sensor histidine kinase PdtaS
VSTLERIAAERTELGEAEIARLAAVLETWDILADLSQADLVLWLPTWNAAGYVAAALVRPTTAPTSVPDDQVGSFLPRGRATEIDRAAHVGGVIGPVDDPRAIAIPGDGRRVCAVVERHATTRSSGAFWDVYARVAGVLFTMLAEGSFPPAPMQEVNAPLAPRVGDGAVILDEAGKVLQASPNAVSAFRRCGLATELVDVDLAATTRRLMRRPGPVDSSLTPIASGRRAGLIEVETGKGSLVMSAWPLVESGVRTGAIVLVRDVTDLRTRDRALLSKEGAVREAHHRVKNNLQTVAALLRLQSRRVQSPEARQALSEAGRRIGAIAAVHDTLAVSAGGLDAGDLVDMDAIIARVVDLSRQLGLSGERALAVDIAVGEVDAEIASPVAMAISELLANAYEHSHASRIWLSAERVDPDDARPHLRFEVGDDGVGMGADSAEGLGLQIVRSLIEEDLRGTVSISDLADGSGTRVLLRVGLTV